MIILEFWWQILAGGVVVYLLCNVNFAYIFVRAFRHKDIRQLGSGNPGSTNVVRNFGFKLGLPTFTCDLLKGIFAALTGRYLMPLIISSDNADLALFMGYFFALCAVIGHMYPVFLRFKGGKGIATSLGAFFVLHPIFTAITIAAAVIIIITTDKVSIFALVHVTAQTIYTAIITAVSDGDLVLKWCGFACVGIMFAVITFAHRANIKRLLNGTEKGIGIKKNLFKGTNAEK